jgi:hypothetical protein
MSPKGEEKMKYFCLFCGALLVACGALAQTKTSGTEECNKADVSHTIQVPDQEGFSYEIAQRKCTWTKSFTVEGMQSTYNVEVGFDEVTGKSGRSTTTGFTQYSNGDKAYHRSTGNLDPNKNVSSGTWTYTHGTGKLRGIQGKGTFDCKPKGNDWNSGYICDVKGEYTLPATKK